MQQYAPPQYSSDGEWWWNGRAWVPVTWLVETRRRPTEPRWNEWDGPSVEVARRRRTPGILWIGVIALLLLLLLSFGGVIGTLVGRAGQQVRGGQATQTQLTPAPVPTPAQTPVTTPYPGGSDAYRSHVDTDVARFQSAAQAVSDNCSAAALGVGTANCQAALQALDGVVQQSQADLDMTPVPACLQPADQELRTALSLYHQGIQEEMRGIDQRDLLRILQGAGTVQVATNHAQHAGSLLQATC